VAVCVGFEVVSRDDQRIDDVDDERSWRGRLLCMKPKVSTSSEMEGTDTNARTLV